MKSLFCIVTAAMLVMLTAACSGGERSTPEVRVSGQWDMGVEYSGAR